MTRFYKSLRETQARRPEEKHKRAKKRCRQRWPFASGIFDHFCQWVQRFCVLGELNFISLSSIVWRMRTLGRDIIIKEADCQPPSFTNLQNLADPQDTEAIWPIWLLMPCYPVSLMTHCFWFGNPDVFCPPADLDRKCTFDLNLWSIGRIWLELMVRINQRSVKIQLSRLRVWSM